jgi:DNA mismatch repair protein MutS
MSTSSEISQAVPVVLPSILGADQAGHCGHALDRDAHRDLLGRLVEHLTERRGSYALEEFFTSIVSAADVTYRHEVFRDLDQPELRDGITTVCRALLRVRQILTMASKLSYDIERQRWFLEAATVYTGAVEDLNELLRRTEPSSRALRGVAAWLERHVTSPDFRELTQSAAELTERLDAIRYRLCVFGDRVQVRLVDHDEPDYAIELLALFDRFRQTDAPSYLKEIRDPGSMDHVDAAIAALLARLHPGPFRELKAFRERHDPLVPPALVRFEREVHFYLAWLELVDETTTRGVVWSLPDIAEDRSVSIVAGRDLILALQPNSGTIVPNDCSLAAHENCVVVTGPNQGGKTTFARMLGQVHALASIGVPVPAGGARVPLVDQVFTIFERGENLNDLRGHLQDDLIRAHRIIKHATPDSLVLLNEAFASTTPQDASFLAGDVLSKVRRLGARCICVTFLDELSRLTSDTVSLVAGVDPEKRTQRTFVVTRRPADGLAYAHAVASKHGLSREELGKRLQP